MTAGQRSQARFAAVLLLGGLWLGGATAQGEPSGLARIDSLNALGREYIFSHIAVSIPLYRDLVAEAQALGYPVGEAAALQNLAVALYLQGRHDEEMEAQLRAIRLYEDLDMPMQLAQAFGDLGYQMKRRDLPRGMDFMRRGIAIAERGGFREILSALYDNFGTLQEMNSAPDSAEVFYHRALELKTAQKDSVGIPYSLNNLAGLHLARGEFDAAAALLTRSDAYRNRLGDAYGQLFNHVQWGDLERERGDLERAAARYRESLALPGASAQRYLSSYCYEQLADIHERLGDFPNAFAVQKRLTAYRDSLNDTETQTRVAALEIEYETERKDRQLAESRLAVAARGRLIAVLAAVALLLAGAAVATWRYQALKRNRLRRELELKERLRQADVARGVADAKLRISRELHDNIGAQLTFLISSVDNLAAGGHATPARLSELGSFGRGTLDELRQTVWAMKHEHEGLEALELRLQEIKRRAAGSGLAVSVDVVRDPDAPQGISSVRLLHLVRIAQEAVQNALKHSGGTCVGITLHASASALILKIADDGAGVTGPGDGASSGLNNMRGRARESGGELTVESVDGTVVTVTLPWE